MAKLQDFSIKLKLIEYGKIIAYKSDEYLTPKEFEKLPKKLQKKFKPIYEQYKVQYVNE